MCRRFYAEMKSRERGVIINVLGVAGEKMDRTYIAGSTGNAALMAFTKALGGSAGDDKLRVVGINPGAIATERLITIMRTRAQDRLGDENRWEELMKPLPMGRAGTAGGDRRDGRVPRLRPVSPIRPGRSSRSMAVPPIAGRCFEPGEHRWAPHAVRMASREPVTLRLRWRITGSSRVARLPSASWRAAAFHPWQAVLIEQSRGWPAYPAMTIPIWVAGPCLL